MMKIFDLQKLYSANTVMAQQSIQTWKSLPPIEFAKVNLEKTTVQKAAAVGLLDTAAEIICNVQCAWLSGMCSAKAVQAPTLRPWITSAQLDHQKYSEQRQAL